MAAPLWSPGKVAAEVTPIGKITAGSYRITIRARVTNRSEVRTWDNENGRGTRLFFECKDPTGEIRCVGFNEKADELNKTIDIDGTYTITNLRTKPVTEETKEQYRLATKHDFELVLSRVSEITPCGEESLPDRAYKLQKIGGLRSLVQPPGEVAVLDVIGVCDHVSKLKEDPLTHGEEYIRVDLHLVDDSIEGENEITLTLWGDQACELAEKVPPFVVVAKNVRLNSYNEGTLNSGDTNMIQVDPDLPEGYELMKWYCDAQG